MRPSSKDFLKPLEYLHFPPPRFWGVEGGGLFVGMSIEYSSFSY